MTQAHAIDPLRVRLLKAELAQARALAETRGLTGLLERAIECVLAGALEQAQLRAEAEPGEHLDFAALTERVARRVLALELEAEACLLVARPLPTKPIGDDDLGRLLELAARPGRWSRQTQALVLLRDAARKLEPAQRARAAQALETLTQPNAPRWVQPAALGTLVSLDAARAFELAKGRLTHDADGEDFIVRSRIVELCARHHKRGWQALLPLVYGDPSELVRLCAARATHAKSELERLAGSDGSHRVRALALIKLRRRFAEAATAGLRRALEHDAHPFVVETAARELGSLCRLRPDVAGAEHAAALARASQRRDLPPTVCATCRELLVEVELLASGGAQLLVSLRLAAEATPLGEARLTTDCSIAGATDEQLSRALAVLSRDDFGLGLTRTPSGLRLHRGERRRFAVWRLLYELLHPGSSKRQAFRHTVVRRAGGDLRAHPQRMAEVTATAVPGERVLVSEQGEWGRHVPLVEDLLSLDLLGPAQLRLASARGVTLVHSPTTLKQRLRARFRLCWGYAELARLRERALASPEQHLQAAYAEEIERRTGITMRLLRTANSGEAPQLPNPVDTTRATSSARLALGPLFGLAGGERSPLEALASFWQELSSYAASSGGNRLSHLAAFAALLLGAMTLRGVRVRRAVERDRRGIPLVIGGWGTRGKSGTERLKAALFQGLGYEVLVKTTGCEAMFIHAVPGVTAHEIFIYRPYDKATVWEQRDVLSLARRFGVKVFLWECMALQPDLVDLLQAQWMRDDYSTITNAYPDHEEVQGPTGFDVATTISQFVPRAGRLLTSEEQMLPLLREQARTRNSRMTEVTARDAELIPEDLLSRFGHAEHPRNVALVLRLARSLGISATVALTEMADHVVPDLGVLKTYGPATWQGRELSFTNGMGANDRAGTLGNWERSGFARLGMDDPGRWLVTVVNNRADRVARSEVFAKLLTEDICAHRHVLIGTNVVGLHGMIERALAAHVETLSLTRDLPRNPEARLPIVRERVRRALERLMLRDLSAAGALAEAAIVDTTELLPMLEALLLPADGQSYAAALAVVTPELRGRVDDASLPFLARAVARRRAARGLIFAVDTRCNGEPERLDALFRATYSDLFRDGIVALQDHKLSGDALISQIASSVPPGARASLMGLQNIKGTGLDFVYRWISLDAVLGMLAELARAADSQRAEVFQRLLAHGDYGLVDASLALTRIDALEPEQTDAERSLRAALRERLRQVIAQRSSAGGSGERGSLGRYLTKLGRASFDFIDSVLRRRRADQIIAALVDARISHAEAARDMRALVARGKARDA